MKTLNLPTYSFKIKSVGDNDYIFDKLRKKYIRLTPEEWVRQNIISFLENERGFPVFRIVQEKSMKVHNLRKRADILVYSSLSDPLLLAECKAPEIRINSDTFLQAAVYNYHFRVKYLLITNGIKHYCCYVNFSTGEISYLKDIPYYSDIDITPGSIEENIP